MRRPILLLPFCLAAVTLAACGNKGPLYMPAKPAPAAAASTAVPAPAHAASVATPAAEH